MCISIMFRLSERVLPVKRSVPWADMLVTRCKVWSAWVTDGNRAIWKATSAPGAPERPAGRRPTFHVIVPRVASYLRFVPLGEILFKKCEWLGSTAVTVTPSRSLEVFTSDQRTGYGVGILCFRG